MGMDAGATHSGSFDAANVVDLERYPIDDPVKRTEVVAMMREGIEREGSSILPGFLTPEGIVAMAAEANSVGPMLHRRERMLRGYGEDSPAGLDPDHPMQRTHPYKMHVAASDQLDPTGVTLTLHEWPPLIRLLADVLDIEDLHPLADPLMRCNITYLSNGDEHGWHFDGNDFVVSLLVQASEAGGAFEFAPGIRTEESPNFDAVRAVMDGVPDTTQSFRAEPGTLALFRGQRALHRVTEVKGSRTRIIALFSYDRRPGLVHDEDTHRRIFARTAGESVVA
ncbi:MAG: hypothetical protein ACI8Y4_004785 [Candidatus Poriferisodalaceae bacterium]|jgi:hypothetical protein